MAGDQCWPAQPRGRSASSPRGLVGGEPVRALPAGLLAEDRAQGLERLVGRRDAQRAAGDALLVGVVDVVVGGVVLVGASEGVGLRAVLGPEAPDVHLPEVELRLAGDDPLGQLLADAAGARDAVGAEAGGHEEAADGRLAEDELVVRA